MSSELWVTHLGVVEYREAYALQERVRAARQAGAIPDTLLLLEHPPVYTRGRRSEPGEIPMGEAWYRAQGIDVVQTDRGGKLTYHGPGQLVGYPIMPITDEDGNDSIAIRPICILGLSWDHRALDGALAAQFLAEVKRRIEGWD